MGPAELLSSFTNGGGTVAASIQANIMHENQQQSKKQQAANSSFEILSSKINQAEKQSATA